MADTASARTFAKCAIFARHDLTRDPAFSRLDLIVCRNVLIYLDEALQKRLFTTFHYALKPTGFLMLGSAETVGLRSDLFTVVDKKHRLYVKGPGYSEPPEMGFSRQRQASRPTAPPIKPTREHTQHRTVQQEVSQVLLSKYAPPGVLVNDRLEIVQFRGQTGYYLEPSPGDVSLHVLKMIRPGLLHELQEALAEARQSQLPVRKEGLHIAFNSHGRGCEPGSDAG
jgi:two-component system CheB/CheR fusion protein